MPFIRRAWKVTTSHAQSIHVATASPHHCYQHWTTRILTKCLMQAMPYLKSPQCEWWQLRPVAGGWHRCRVYKMSAMLVGTIILYQRLIKSVLNNTLYFTNLLTIFICTLYIGIQTIQPYIYFNKREPVLFYYNEKDRQ